MEKIKGGKASKMTVEDIAKKHKVDVSVIQKQLEKGIKVEKEHTPDEKTAKEIAMDHLTEFPDYYSRLHKMEKTAEKSMEAKECMGADSSGSYEAPLSKTILKRDIHKLHNFKRKQQEVDEVTDSSSSGQFDAPIGHGAKTQADALKLDNVETKGSASITAAPTKNMTAMKKGFPRYGGPGGKYVEIDKKCKTFPYCNQGADNQIKLHEGQILQIYESDEVKNVISDVSKEYGIPIKEVQKIVLDSLLTEGLPKSFFDDPGNMKAFRGWTEPPAKTKYKVTTKEPLSFIMADDVDLAKLKLIFYKHDVNFDTEEIKD